MLETRISEQSTQKAQDKFKQGQDLASQGNIDNAISAYRNAIELDPTLLAPRSQLGNTLCEQQRFKEAVEVYQEAIKLKSDAHCISRSDQIEI